jgi:shikimate dehydrogenase
MHNVAFGALGLDYVYVPFHIPRGELREAIDGLKSLGVRGLNVTIPHKEEALHLADHASNEAKLIGAANTLTFEDGLVAADNTDYGGFIRAVEIAGMDLTKCEKALVLGAGGSSRSVCVALAHKGVREIIIANRTFDKARGLAKSIADSYGGQVRAVPLGNGQFRSEMESSDLLVNTTPVGMKQDDPVIVDINWLHPGIAVYDLIYTPPETKLVKTARERGLRCAGGIDMLVFQGALSFEIWTGSSPPIDLMRSALMKALGVA